jgi:hypothetical protein
MTIMEKIFLSYYFNNCPECSGKEKIMPTLPNRIISFLRNNPGLTDREITDSLNGHSAGQQPVNQACHKLKQRGILIRRTRQDGLIGNYLTSQASSYIASTPLQNVPKSTGDDLSEDEVKHFLEKWLVAQGWEVQVAWGGSPGVDIQARQGDRLWLIEAKGCGSRSAMRVNYFLGAIGELLQRMKEPHASYSIAFPDMQQFRNLWERLPDLAKRRTEISALFVGKDGNVIRL